ncbi:MAG: DMT family transporter [Burkholderiaceae bacterium]|nr:DMT family transporter [Burkholderiaceae bacterium]
MTASTRPIQPAPTPTERSQQVARAIGWAVAASIGLVGMNASMRLAVQTLDPFVGQFFRYLFGLVLALPLMLRGLAWLKPRNLPGQLWRGFAQGIAITLFYVSLKYVPLADAIAILFTSPIVVLIGSALFLGEKVRPARWVAAFVGLGGVVVLLSPNISGQGSLFWSLVMLSSVPFWAATFLITKWLTRSDSTDTIVAWQNLTITLFTIPMAIMFWHTPSLRELLLTMLAGFCGTAGHWCLTRAMSLADLSVVQPLRFLDLVWSSLLGIVLFGNIPTAATLIGGTVIVLATIWLARSETRR